MSLKKILTVDVELASEDAEDVDFRSKTSLLDWDIVLLKPQVGEFFSAYDEYYQGKRSLNDSASFRLKECCEHWRREIKQAVDNGKTVIVFLPELQEVYVDTGQRTYSGTGRNQKVTHHVELYDNYRAIPAPLQPIAANGSAMKLSPRGAESISAYWAEFEGASAYKVILSDEEVPACIVTKSGNKPVGALYRSKSSSGTLLLLPEIDFYLDGFLVETNGEVDWTEAAVQFAARMVHAAISLDKVLRTAGEVTPEPQWACESRYTLSKERKLQMRLMAAEKQVEIAQRRKEAVLDELKAAQRVRSLLYEKGKPLENVIIEALRSIGFTAELYRDSSSEFDAVFESDEGRLIGEAEGKDNKPVNVEKLRQLSMNVHEDLQREEVSVPAKPVLFGNSFRLSAPGDRGEPFTEKCLQAAAASSTALIFTPDLFEPVQYLLNHPKDADYARACRMAIVSTTGRVVFPKSPDNQMTKGAQADDRLGEHQDVQSAPDHDVDGD